MTPRSSLTVVLAAGEGTRMQSSLPKVLHPIAGQSLLAHVLRATPQGDGARLAVVVGPHHRAVEDEVKRLRPDAATFVQRERLGTAHAVLAARGAIAGGADDLLVVFGDTPLISAETFERLRAPLRNGATLAVLGFRAADPSGYGRLLLEGDRLTAIREHADATAAERDIKLCNAGVMAFDGHKALDIMDRIGNANSKGEFYLGDAVNIVCQFGWEAVVIETGEDEVRGINNKAQLAEAEGVMQARLRRAALDAGVTLIAPETVYLAAEALLIAGSDAQKQKWLPAIASGEAIGTLALFEGKGNPSPQAIRLDATGGSLNGGKKPVPDGAIADFAIVAARTGSSGRDSDISLFIVDMKGGGVEAKELTNLDSTRGQAELTFSNCRAEPLGATGEGWSILSQVLDRAAVLIAFEQVGGSDRALEMGRDYALDRIAFGRPIGSFQAVKHMLADMYVSATLARSNCYYGAWALSTNASELPEAAAAARISATQAFQHCAKNNIQVHGGMGFTWEFDCHMYYRRANALALSLGSLSYWEDALIDRMRKRNAA